MRVVLQRVVSGHVSIDSVIVGKIGKGVVALVALAPEDTILQARWMMEKLLSMRLFEGESGTMDYSLPQVGGEILLVSQFTLYGDVRKGTRPSFSKAMQPSLAKPLFEQFVTEFQARYPDKVQSGQFGANMQVALVNDGPITLIIDS